MAVKLKKAQYYVWYLGWKECRGLAGREFTEPLVNELLQRRSQEELPKLTIEVNKKELKVIQLVEKKKGKIEKVKYPSIPCRDITFVVQALPPYDDVIACIYLGYNPTTKCAVHVHVYRCDSPDTAAIFVSNLDLVVQIPDHQVRHRKIEEELAAKGHIVLRPDTRLEGYLHHQFNPEQQHHHHHHHHRHHGQHSKDKLSSQQQNGQNRRSNYSEESGGGDFVAMGSTSHSSGSDPHSPRNLSLNQGDYIPQQQQHQLPRSPIEETTPYPLSSVNIRSSDSPDRHIKMTQKQLSSEIDEAQQQEFESLAAELKSKLGKEPLLLPPKDYDTIHRKRGNAFDIQNRKCLNHEIVGQYGYSLAEQSDNVFSSGQAKGVNDNGQTKGANMHIDPKSNGGLPRQNSQSSFNQGSLNGSEEELCAFLNDRPQNVQRLASDNSIPENVLNQQVPPPIRPFSPGPLTKELKNTSYFPEKGPDLPNYLRKMQGSHQSLNRYSSGEPSEDGDRRGYYTLDSQSPPGSKYSASTLGLKPRNHRILKKQQSSPEFEYGQSQQQPGYNRHQRSIDDGYQNDYPPGHFYNNVNKYSSPPRSGRSSGSNTMRSDPYEQNNNNIDLAASMPAMKFKEFRRQNSSDLNSSNSSSRIYMDEDDPGSYVPIDYTVAVRGQKIRKAIP